MDTGDLGRQGDDGVSMNALVTPHPVQGTVSCLQDCTGDDLQPLSALSVLCSVVYNDSCTCADYTWSGEINCDLPQTQNSL